MFPCLTSIISSSYSPSSLLGTFGPCSLVCCTGESAHYAKFSGLLRLDFPDCRLPCSRGRGSHNLTSDARHIVQMTETKNEIAMVLVEQTAWIQVTVITCNVGRSISSRAASR
ncbi:hypothetical protein EXIGLDRAFT_267321 [Exidia glandulosa HHB12029]|uniref:Uncharacterized protein n=1 Tax=Exidia glandulosa HHB12029 TaxID=1314781 RepID=A0A165MBQ8_EXIGL|nr:hypothetical protein EXIGLDRAFT_267321 [Exidia glandulosa HHB12029]